MNEENINLPKLNKEEVKKEITKVNKNLKEFLIDIKGYITSRNTKELFDLLIRLLIIAAFIIILYVPFQLLIEIAPNILIIFGINYSTNAVDKYVAIVKIIYSILGIVLFFKLAKDRYYILIKQQEEIDKTKN